MVTAGKDEIDVAQLDMALFLASITAPKRAGMIAACLWPGTILEALDHAVYEIRVTPACARVAALESLITW
jgi:hypothetical protein